MIIHNIFEYSKHFDFPKDKLVGFKTYLNEIWTKRNQYGVTTRYETDETEELVEQNEEIGDRNKNAKNFFNFDGNACRAKNYVGFIQYEDIRINIYPKIVDKTENYSEIIKQVFYWLSYGKRLHFPFSEVPYQNQHFDDWIEAYIYLFVHYTTETLSAQPYQTYQEVTEETTFLRGRLAMSDYIRENLITGRHQHFQSIYEPFVYDNQFNRIVKNVTKTLLKFSTNEKNHEKLHELLFLLDEVSEVSCVATDCDKVSLNPLYQDLNMILSMCRMFLEHSSVSDNNNNSDNISLLFPMEIIFEDFIFGFIEKHFPERKPNAQKKSYLALDKSGKGVFSIKNDIILKYPYLIIDTKYKIRVKIDRQKGISQADLYQMLAYAVRREIDQVLLIYPMVGKLEHEVDSFVINDKFAGDKPITIKATDIDICSEEYEIKEQLERIL